MLDLVIRGGQVVTPEGVGVWDVGVEGDRIATIAAPGTLPLEAARAVDATGKLIIPGGIDPHVHTHWPIPALGGGHTTSAPPEQVSRAAIYGGTTTLVDFAVWEPGLTLAGAIEAKEAVWRRGYTDYGLHVMLQGAVRPRSSSRSRRRSRRGSRA
jgi:dihydropyrimidinase